MFEANSPRGTPVLAYAIPILAIAAPALGGSTTLWAKAIIAFATGLLFILYPPKRSLRWLAIIFLAIFALALMAYLPASWFGFPQWRLDLTKMDAQLPATLSPQPWLTLESICLLLLGLGWAYYLIVADWSSSFRERALVVYCFGILGLAATMSAAFALQKRIPFWNDASGFGFFQNRNETGNVLALGGVMIYALSLQRWQEGRKDWWLWLISVCLILWALIVNFSRAGIVLFFLGALGWHLWWLFSSKEKRRPALLLIVLVLLGVVLAWNGSAILARFRNETGDFFSLSRNGRLAIYRDSFEFLKQSPFLGIGLGNFRGIFSSQRHFFVSKTESIHPESDWFWTATEMGSLVCILLLAAVAIWLRNCFPLRAGTRRAIRVGAIICGLLFVFHGFLDVPGHRVGSLWPALFLCAVAINSQLNLEESRIARRGYPILGGVVMLIAIWWGLSIFTATRPPTTSVAERLRGQVERANNEGNYQNAISLADQGLAIAPLNWAFYYERALAEAASYAPRSKIEHDFAIARYLLPNWPDLALNEGLIWLSVGNADLAFSVWEESMRRWPAIAAELYSRMFDSIRTNVDLRDRWRQLGHFDPQCRLILLQNSERLEFQLELERLLAEDPELRSFPPAKLKILFEIWFKQGDQLALIETLKQHPDWKKVAWRELARSYADFQDYHEAWKVAEEFGTPPKLPRGDSNEPLEKLSARFVLDRTNVQNGLDLYWAQKKSGQNDAALATLRQLTAAPNAPKYLWYLESQLWAEKGDWPTAWKAWAQFELATEQ